MTSVFDVLWLRRPKIEYISPPVCPFIIASGVTSGSGSGAIISDFPLAAPIASCESGVLVWQKYPGELCVSLYKKHDDGVFCLVHDCLKSSGFKLQESGCFAVTVVTLDGESPLSNLVCGCETASGAEPIIVDEC